jgi:hypothetical protein
VSELVLVRAQIQRRLGHLENGGLGGKAKGPRLEVERPARWGAPCAGTTRLGGGACSELPSSCAYGDGPRLEVEHPAHDADGELLVQELRSEEEGPLHGACSKLPSCAYGGGPSAVSSAGWGKWHSPTDTARRNGRVACSSRYVACCCASCWRLKAWSVKKKGGARSYCALDLEIVLRKENVQCRNRTLCCLHLKQRVTAALGLRRHRRACMQAKR